MGMMGGRSLRRPKGAALWNPASRRCTERTGDRARSGEPYRGQGFVPPRGRNAAQARFLATTALSGWFVSTKVRQRTYCYY